MSERPPVPDPVKRILRQEAGFGCCKCGYPLYDYHHIIPYADDNHFRPQDMMVLCPNCHREVKNGLLNEQKQRQFKNHPYNIICGEARGPLAIEQSTLVVALGGNVFAGNGTFIQVDRQPLLRLSLSPDNIVLLSVALYDQNNHLLGLINKNEWIVNDPYPWDLEYGGGWLIVRREQGEISLEVDARRGAVSVRGSLWFNQHHFKIRNDTLEFNSPISNSEHSRTIRVGFLGSQFVNMGMMATTSPPSLAIASTQVLELDGAAPMSNSDEQVSQNSEMQTQHVMQMISPVRKLAGSNRPCSQMPLPHRRRKENRPR